MPKVTGARGRRGRISSFAGAPHTAMAAGPLGHGRRVAALRRGHVRRPTALAEAGVVGGPACAGGGASSAGRGAWGCLLLRLTAASARDWAVAGGIDTSLTAFRGPSSILKNLLCAQLHLLDAFQGDGLQGQDLGFAEDFTERTFLGIHQTCLGQDLLQLVSH